MSISPSESKKIGNYDTKQATESFGKPDTGDITSESNENKWKRRLDSLRRSLARRRIPTASEPEHTDRRSQKNFDTKECSNGYLPTVSQTLTHKNGCHSKMPYTDINEDSSSIPNQLAASSAAADDGLPLKKRKRFTRRKKDHTVGGKKISNILEQELENHNTSVVDNDTGVHDKQNRGKSGQRGTKTKSMLTFPSWFKSLGRSSGKNTRLKSRHSLSVSTGNFTERDNNFKLLRDVRLLRDPGYVSSSMDSLDRNDVDEDKYNSLRRSRASLIDIRWHKHSRSETNLTSSKSPPLNNNFKKRTSTRGLSSPKVNGNSQARETISSCNNNSENSSDVTTVSKTAGMSAKNISTENVSMEFHNTPSITKQSYDNVKLITSHDNLDDDDIYLTAEEDATADEYKRNLTTLDEVLDFRNNSTRHRTSSVSLPVRTLDASSKHLTKFISLKEYQETKTDNIVPSLITHIPKTSLSQSQPAITSNCLPGSPTESHLCSGLSCFECPNSQTNSEASELDVLNPSKNTPPVFYNSQTKIHSPTDAYYDVVFTRPPKQPAPKPPAHIKHRSQSLTTLGGTFPVLSEQLHLNEMSSVHKLNDSCSDNLCELVSQSKNRSQSSEGLYVGIMGDQGVILRKKRIPKPKRGFSMPSELLENVMEVDVKEESDWSITGDSNLSEINSENSENSVSLLQSSESEVFLSCTSKSPSPVAMNTVKKEICIRSISISSIEVRELNQNRKGFSISVPCLTKDCFLKSSHDQMLHEDNYKRSAAQSMMSLNQPENIIDEMDAGEKAFGKPLLYAEALWDHVTMNEEQLCFTAGQAIAVYDIDDSEWWFGLLDDHIGWFPASFVRIPVSEDLWNKYQNSVGEDPSGEDCNYQVVTGEMRGNSCLSRAEIRAKIVEEIMKTEEDYVQNLKNIVEGYLKQAKRRPDMFSDKLLRTIFSNIEDIYHFHLDFLQYVRNQKDEEKPSVRQIGEAFVKNRQKFSLYSEYCNNHPRASQELKNLLQQDKYRYFFEACRLLQEMIRISLDGFLLTPVQKICKYPLQLQELLKYTDPEHSDYENVKKALETMREVASCINEEKRKVDNIKKIAEWQLTVQQWMGEDVLVKSSQLVHSGEVIKIWKGKTQEVTLFLFDHQLIFCKKDVLKKYSFEYKGRIVLENYKFEKLEDGEVSHNSAAVTNAWRLSNKQSNSSCLLQAKSPEQRDKWVKYFLKERQIVYESTSGNSIPTTERLAAMDSAKNTFLSEKPKVKSEKEYGKFNTVGRAIGQLHYGNIDKQPKINLPPPVSSAMLFKRNQPETASLGLRRNSGLFKRKRTKAKT